MLVVDIQEPTLPRDFEINSSRLNTNLCEDLTLTDLRDVDCDWFYGCMNPVLYALQCSIWLSIFFANFYRFIF